MGLTKVEIERIARLARLELSEAEEEEFTRQINRILGFIERLNRVDTTGVEPTAHVVPLFNVFRSDQTEPSLDPEAALANAPERDGNFFKVPKVLED